MKSLVEYKQELLYKEEVEILDLLEITTPDLVDRFEDRVEEHWELDDIEDDIDNDFEIGDDLEEENK